MITWIFGQSGQGKTTLAKKIRRHEILLDGDDMRSIWSDLGFSDKDRWENNIRIANLAKLLDNQGFDIIVATILPYRKLRGEVKKITKCKFIDLGGESKLNMPYEK